MFSLPSFEVRMRFALGIGLVFAGVALAGLIWPGMMPETLHGFFTGVSFGLLVCWACFTLLPRWCKDAMDIQHQTKAGRQYLRRMMPAMFAYVILLPVSMFLIRRGIDQVFVRALVALMPVLPIALILFAFFEYVRNVDEFQRKIELESIGIAAMVVSLGYMSAGFLQLAKVIHFDAGAAMIWVFPILSISYGLGKFVALRRYL